MSVPSDLLSAFRNGYMGTASQQDAWSVDQWCAHMWKEMENASERDAEKRELKEEQQEERKDLKRQLRDEFAAQKLELERRQKRQQATAEQEMARRHRREEMRLSAVWERRQEMTAEMGDRLKAFAKVVAKGGFDPEKLEEELESPEEEQEEEKVWDDDDEPWGGI